MKSLSQNPNPGLKYYYPIPDTSRAIDVDVCICGGTSAGVAAALYLARAGVEVAVAEFGRHLGGLTSGGLGATDIGNKAAIGGVSREFYRALGTHYGTDEQWTFEPHVAEGIYNNWVQTNDIPVYFEQRPKAVNMEDDRITELLMEDGTRYRAKMFIDAGYEGDLLALAGVSYTFGREANATYDETYNGVQYGTPNHLFHRFIDPYVEEGNPGSGLVYGISNDAMGIEGSGDRCIQAYNFRVCLTDDESVKLPYPKPDGYDRNHYELLLRYAKAGIFDAMRLHKEMPNHKTDLNNYGGFSSDHIGANYGWPDGDYATRERIFQDHVRYNQGMLYFLANDAELPQYVRDHANRWGVPADEFLETGHWPHQLYIREARRMVSDYVMTEHDCVGRFAVEDPVGLAAYTMDSHNCRRIVHGGRAVNEGNVEIGGFTPYPISYRSIVPKRGECSNLLVPVCLSASHIAFGSIRMEPVFMILGQSAATAALLAMDKGCPVQDVPYDELKKELVKDGQVLAWEVD